VSEQETTEQVETVETTATPDNLGPDGTPWDPQRAMRTIENLRGFEPSAKAYERLSSGEDSEAFAKLAEQYGYELAQEEEDAAWAEPTEDPRLSQHEKELAELREFKSEIQLERQVTAFQNDVAKLSSAKGVELSERQVKFILAAAVNDPKGLSSASTKAAFDDLVEELEAYEQGLISKHGIKPKAPRKPVSGEAASQNPDLHTREDIVKHMLSRMSDSED